MVRDIQRIPPAPRPVRWRAAAAFCWPLALIGFILFVYGGLWTLMFTYAASGKPRDDRRLDETPTIVAGEVTAIEATGVTFRNEIQEHVRYRFTPPDTDGRALDGACYLPLGRTTVGARTEVEFLAVAPHVNRLRGGRLTLLRDFATPAIWFVVLPGALSLLAYAFGVLGLRRLLATGDVAVAEVREATPVPLTLPGMLRVRYAYRDRRAESHEGCHWVRQRAALGHRIDGGETRVAVVHGRGRPGFSRLVTPDAFHDPARPAQPPQETTTPAIDA